MACEVHVIVGCLVHAIHEVGVLRRVVHRKTVLKLADVLARLVLVAELEQRLLYLLSLLITLLLVKTVFVLDRFKLKVPADFAKLTH